MFYFHGHSGLPRSAGFPWFFVPQDWILILSDVSYLVKWMCNCMLFYIKFLHFWLKSVQWEGSIYRLLMKNKMSPICCSQWNSASLNIGSSGDIPVLTLTVHAISDTLLPIFSTANYSPWVGFSSASVGSAEFFSAFSQTFLTNYIILLFL